MKSYDGIAVTVEELQEEQDSRPSYTATWENDNVIYWLSGKIEKEELKKILEQMVY